MDVKNVWPFKTVAQAQGQDPDIGPVVDQLSPELKEPTDKELQPLSRATYKRNLGKLELLLLREGVLYLGTLSA